MNFSDHSLGRGLRSCFDGRSTRSNRIMRAATNTASLFSRLVDASVSVSDSEVSKGQAGHGLVRMHRRCFRSDPPPLLQRSVGQSVAFVNEAVCFDLLCLLDTTKVGHLGGGVQVLLNREVSRGFPMLSCMFFSSFEQPIRTKRRPLLAHFDRPLKHCRGRRQQNILR